MRLYLQNIKESESENVQGKWTVSQLLLSVIWSGNRRTVDRTRKNEIRNTQNEAPILLSYDAVSLGKHFATSQFPHLLRSEYPRKCCRARGCVKTLDSRTSDWTGARHREHYACIFVGMQEDAKTCTDLFHQQCKWAEDHFPSRCYTNAQNPWTLSSSYCQPL